MCTVLGDSRVHAREAKWAIVTCGTELIRMQARDLQGSGYLVTEELMGALKDTAVFLSTCVPVNLFACMLAVCLLPCHSS